MEANNLVILKSVHFNTTRTLTSKVMKKYYEGAMQREYKSSGEREGQL